MALLHLLESGKEPYVICHVNYHHRPTAGRDENIVREFAKANHRELYILHPSQSSGNFQAAAREARYAFFADVCAATGASVIALGHQMDDHIETWMMQKERNALCQRYGLSVWSEMENLKLWRPLLSFTKSEIQAYMDVHHLPYGIDESNLSNDYRRNQIRHSRIENASYEQKKEWLKEIEEDNRRLKELNDKAEKLLESGLRADDLIHHPEGWLALEKLLFSLRARADYSESVLFSKASLIELARALQSGKRVEFHDFSLQSIDGIVHAKRSDQIHVPLYADSEKHLRAMCENHFAFDGVQFAASGKTIESFGVFQEDFPVYIRQNQPGDRILMRFGSKKISRLLIDRKVPALWRDDIRVIEGRKGILFAPFAGCDLDHYVERDRLFMVELPA